MNILVYSVYYPAPAEMKIAADTLIVHYFVRELQKAGHTVQVVYLSMATQRGSNPKRLRDILPSEADYVYDGVPVHLFRALSLIPYRENPSGLQAAWINHRLRALKKRLGWKADKVFVHFPSAFTGVTEIFGDGAPVLGDFHNKDIWMLNKRYLTKGYGKKIAAFLRRIDHWGYRNIRVKAGLEKLGPHSMVRTYSGIDRALLASEAFIREKMSVRRPVTHILYAGQLIPLKNVDILIRAAQTLAFDWDLTIVGDGPERARLEKLAAGCGRIRFTGRLSREETINRMKDADVFIMLSSPETYGLVYLEAMANGCVTVASRGEGFDGIIESGKNGFLENPASVEDAARVLTAVHGLSDEGRREVILNGYRLAASMTEDQTARRFLDDNHSR